VFCLTIFRLCTLSDEPTCAMGHSIRGTHFLEPRRRRYHALHCCPHATDAAHPRDWPRATWRWHSALGHTPRGAILANARASFSLRLWLTPVGCRFAAKTLKKESGKCQKSMEQAKKKAAECMKKKVPPSPRVRRQRAARPRAVAWSARIRVGRVRLVRGEGRGVST